MITVCICRAQSVAVLVQLLKTATSPAHYYKQQVLRPGHLRRYRHQCHHNGDGVSQNARGVHDLIINHT